MRAPVAIGAGKTAGEDSTIEVAAETDIELREAVTVTGDELREWIDARVAAKYQRLARVIVMDDFPRSAAGKTLKREMRAPFWGGGYGRSDVRSTLPIPSGPAGPGAYATGR